MDHPSPPLVDRPSSSAPASSSSLADPPSNVFGSGVTPTSAVTASTSSPTSLPPDAIIDALASTYPDLANLSSQQVQHLLQDQDLFDAYFNTTPQAMQQHRLLEQAWVQNLELAQKNEALRPRLQDLRDQTLHHFDAVNELKERWDLLHRAQAEHYQHLLPQAQQARLARATHAQEYTSEALVNAFLDGQIDDEVFVQQYKAVRQLYHRREIALTKWQQGLVSWR